MRLFKSSWNSNPEAFSSSSAQSSTFNDWIRLADALMPWLIVCHPFLVICELYLRFISRRLNACVLEINPLISESLKEHEDMSSFFILHVIVSLMLLLSVECLRSSSKEYRLFSL